MADKRPTLPQRLSTAQAGIKMHPPGFEHDALSWAHKPASRVLSARFDIEGTRYDLTLTERHFVSTMLSQSQGKRDADGGGEYDRQFTLTLWGWWHDSLGIPCSPMPASSGISYRWREGDHIHYTTLAEKMHIGVGDAVPILKLLESAGHSVSYPDAIVGGEVSNA